MYGGDAYPAPYDTLSLVAAGLMNIDNNLIQDVKLEEILRDNVMQAPLVKVWPEYIAQYSCSPHNSHNSKICTLHHTNVDTT